MQFNRSVKLRITFKSPHKCANFFPEYQMQGYSHSTRSTIHPVRVRVSVIVNFFEVVFISGMMK